MTQHKVTERLSALKSLYPSFTEDELGEADSFWRRYLELACRILKGVRADPDRYAQFLSLTDRMSGRTMNTQRPKPSIPK